MLTKFHNITNLKKWLQVGFRTFYRASESSPFNRSPWVELPLTTDVGFVIHMIPVRQNKTLSLRWTASLYPPFTLLVGYVVCYNLWTNSHSLTCSEDHGLVGSEDSYRQVRVLVAGSWTNLSASPRELLRRVCYSFKRQCRRPSSWWRISSEKRS
jgi:hypothetical protein